MNFLNRKSGFLFAAITFSTFFIIAGTAQANVQQTNNTAGQTIDNVYGDNFFLGQIIGDNVSGTVEFITLHLKLTANSYSQNSDHRIYLNFYRSDTGENLPSLLYSYLMSESDIGIEQDVTFTPHGGIPRTFERGIPYAFVGNFKSATYYGSSDASAYALGFAFYAGNVAGGPTENFPPRRENMGSVKDLYFVFSGLGNDTVAQQLDDNAISLSPMSIWQQTLGNGLDFSVKDLTIHVSNPDVDAFYSGTIYGFPTADYASGYGVTPLEQYSFVNLGASTPSGFDGKVTLTMQGSSLSSFPLNPNRYYEIFLNAGDASRQFSIYGSSNIDSYPNGRSYYSDYWTHRSCGFQPYFNPEQVCGSGADIGIEDIYFLFNSSTTSLSGTETRITTHTSLLHQALFPAVDGDTIAWVESNGSIHGNIYMYRISTGEKTQITHNPQVYVSGFPAAGFPAISGNKIVWRNTSNGISYLDDIYMYDVASDTETKITQEMGHIPGGPDIDGNRVVWEALLPGGGGTYGLYMYDTSNSRTTLIDTSGSWSNPKISGDKILYLWSEYSWTRNQLYVYDIATKQKNLIFCGNFQDIRDFDIYGDKIICAANSGASGGGMYIMLHDIATGEEKIISPVVPNMAGVSIFENKIVWSDVYDVFIYDIATGRTGRTGMAPEASMQPKISGNTVVWSDNGAATNENPNPSVDIYMYQLAPLAPQNNPPTLSFPESSPDGLSENDGIDDNKGTAYKTLFDFDVIYTDKDNNAPSSVNLIVEKVKQGTFENYFNLEMLPIDPQTFEMTFPKGDYRYHFEASDGKGGTARIPATDKLIFQVTNVPVIIVPGIMGSYLFGVGDIERQEPYWPPLRDDILFPLISPLIYKLSLGEDGHTRQTVDFLGDYNVMVASSMIRKYEDADVFESLFKTLVDNYGYKEGDDLFEFPYDWRLDITESALSLQRKIEEIGADKVDIIAHSQGGLVSKIYIANNGRDKVRKFIDIATPHLGTPKAFKTLMWGDDLGQKFLSNIARNFLEVKIKDVSQNMPSVYQLLPSERYFVNNPTNLDYKNYQYYFANGDNIEIPAGPLSYDQSMRYLVSAGRNGDASEWNRTLHDSTDNWNGANYGVEETINIVGCKTATIGQIFTFSKIKERDTQLKKGYALHYISGDDTVPLRSADNDLSLNAQRKFYIPDAKHGVLPSSVPSLEIIPAVLSGNKSVLDMLENKYNRYDDKDSDNCKFDGEEVAFFSPIEVHVYDKDGRHTGIMPDGTIERNIPGVAYYILNDGKFIFLPTGLEYTITGKATSLGSFDSRIATIQDDHVTQALYFDEVPLTSLNTRILIDADQSQSATAISVDQNGDGLFESSAEPSAVLNAEESNDITQPITEILVDGSKLNGENFYRDDVTASLTATDDNSGVLKIEYSLDGGQTWNLYSDTIHITQKGITTISYFSTDRAGNKENMKLKDVLKVTDVTTVSKLVQSGVRFNRRTGQFSIRATWKNTGADPFLQPLQMVIEKITPSTVTVANADGITDGGKPYFDFSNMAGDGILASKETSGSKDLIFNNPSRVRFSFDVSLWAN